MFDYEVISTKDGRFAIVLQIPGYPFTHVVDGFVEVMPGAPVIHLNPQTGQFEQYRIDFQPEPEPASPSGGFSFLAPLEYLVKDDYHKTLPHMPLLAEACYHWFESQRKLAQSKAAFQLYQLNLQRKNFYDHPNSVQ